MDAHPHRLVVSPFFRQAAQRARRAVGLIAVFLAGVVLTGCNGHRGGQTVVEVPARKTPVADVITPGDTLVLTFRKLPELNQRPRVRTDGRVNLLQVGSVKAAGRSLDSFQRDLAARYELKSAGDLSVSRDATHSAVYVTGAVGNPGKVPLDRPLTVLEAIMECGGFERTTANLKKVSLTRSVNGRYVTKWMDLRDPAEGGEYVQAYDMIEVGRYFQ